MPIGDTAEPERDLVEEIRRARETADQTQAAIQQTKDLRWRVITLIERLDDREMLTWARRLKADLED